MKLPVLLSLAASVVLGACAHTDTRRVSSAASPARRGIEPMPRTPDERHGYSFGGAYEIWPGMMGYASSIPSPFGEGRVDCLR